MAAMPDLAEIATALFGDCVNTDALIAKMDPGVSDVHVMGGSNQAGTPPLRGRATGRRLRTVRKDSPTGKRVLAVTGATATGIGGVLGLRELGGAATELGHPGVERAVARGGKMIPAGARAALKNPKVRLGAVGGMLVGDGIATGEQIHAMRRRQRSEQVVKAVPFKALVGGFVHGSRVMSGLHAPDVVASTHRFGEGVPALREKATEQAARKKSTVRSFASAPKGRGFEAVQNAGGPKRAANRLQYLRTARADRMPPKPTPTPKSPFDSGIAAGQAARSDIGRMAQTTSGKVALGAGGLVAARGIYRHRPGQGGNAPADPYAYAKRYTANVTFTGTFSKFDDEKRLAFGWANVSKVDGLPVVDRQGDFVSIEDIEEAAYEYVQNCRVGGNMHRRIGGKSAGTIDRPHHVADLVESMVFDDAKCDALGLDDSFPRGWWVGFKIFDDESWEEAKDGRKAGFSIHGKGIRKSVDYDELMGA